MNIPPELEQAARARVERSHAQILNSIEKIREGNPLAAEPVTDRLRERLQAKAQLSREEASAITFGIRALERMPAEQREIMMSRPEAIYGRTIDFVGVSFLERGAKVARAVARVAFRDGRAQGSGFMVSDRLFLTNKHVIQSAEGADQFVIEFDYELDPADRPKGTTRFAVDARTFYVSDEVDNLDYALVAVGEKVSGSGSLADFSWCVLSDAADKHALGEVANIIQHPDGRYKELVLRENSLVARLDFVLHYVADTEPGSSGSPVFNNEWQVIALHHWGGPWRQQSDDQGRPLPREINEGIRISSVIRDLRGKLAALSPDRRRLLQPVVSGSAARPTEAVRNDADGPPEGRVGADGSVTWRIPIEISVRLPMLDGQNRQAPARDEAPASDVVAVEPAPAAEAVKPSTDYSTRGGYKERFIEGFTVPLPALSDGQRDDAARNQEAEPGDDPFELRYHHFSVVMNRKRRLAFFTACNIDGSKAKHVDRKTGKVTPLEPGDPRLEESLAGAEGAEASESWYDDRRLNPEDYAGKDIYEKQVVPGFPDTQSQGRILRMFQRGHLIRRMDPAWGTDKQALLADADTFHWTNCSPQVGFFNMGRASSTTAGTGGGKLWRAVENYVLRNAVAENTRVCSFTGPVFRANDRQFRTIRVPMRFWKIVVWAEDGTLRSLAMIADQSKVIKEWPEAIGEAAEAFGDPSELEKVEDFLTSVAEIEKLTGLDIGEAVRGADIRSGENSERVNDFSSINLTPRTRRAPTRPRRKR